MKGFKDFLMRGNLVELAVAVVIGLAFAAVVNSLVANLITPLIAIPGSTNFSDLKFTISGSDFLYGAFLNDLITFVVIAAAVYFFVVVPIGRLMARTQKVEAATTKPCAECLSEIPVAARKCAHCASPQQVVPAQSLSVDTPRQATQ